jgi:peptidoglycan/xylan/chitin deacetylase (PgdA/CDA1 family)
VELPALHVVMYHYVRDLPNTPFPKIKGMLTGEFRRQLAVLRNYYEMATLESGLDFLQGAYTPARDLSLLTFDDGFKEHYADITPILADQGIQGLFFVITSCLQEHRVVSVHMNHFLMAALDFEQYQRAFMERLSDIAPSVSASINIDPNIAQRTYRWDTSEVASFKYLFNFVLDSTIRDQVVKSLFEENIGDEKSFSRTLYLNWEEARQMQSAGMVIGGHSHQHKPLSSLSDKELESDLALCHKSLKEKLLPQPLSPFCYPYGNRDSFNGAASKWLRHLGFACSFSTEVGSNTPGTDAFAIRRFDCNDMGALLPRALT